MENKKVDLKIEELEERIAPGLVVTLPAGGAAAHGGPVPATPVTPGAAAAHTGGGGAAAISQGC